MDKMLKEAELHRQVQMIEGHCRVLYNITDGKQEMTRAVIETMHDICKQMLDKLEKYYVIEAELHNM